MLCTYAIYVDNVHLLNKSVFLEMKYNFLFKYIITITGLTISVFITITNTSFIK